MSQDKKYYNTVTGDIVTINDAFPNVPFEDVSADINPVQDLHGYDYPWVGGAGKNLLNNTEPPSAVDKAGVIFTPNGDGTITVSGTPTGFQAFYLSLLYCNSSMGPIVFSGLQNAVNIVINTIKIFDVNNNIIHSFGDGRKSATVDLSLYPEAYSLRVELKRETNGVACSGIIKPQIEFGSVATSYAPYANICPISGYTAAKVYRTGKNLLPHKTGTYTDGTRTLVIDSDGSVTISGIRSGSFTAVAYSNPFMLPAGTYILNGQDDADPTNKKVTLQLKNATTNAQIMNLDTSADASFTLSSDTTLQVLIGFRDGANVSNVVMHPMIRKAGADAIYEPFGNTYNIDLSSAGTVYKGQLDVTAGKLRVTHKMQNLGSLTWNLSQISAELGNRFFTDVISDINSPSSGSIVADIISSQYKACSQSEIGVGTVGIAVSSTARIHIYDANYKAYSTAAFQTAMDGVQALYELATPLEYTLTPTQIQALVGQNNLWADSGNITVKYLTDQSYIPVKIYAGSPLALLPSPVSVKQSRELIWSADTGRAQSGSSQAKMIGDVVAHKRTFEIKWGVIPAADYDLIVSKLTGGFFNFGMGLYPVNFGKFYRSEIQGEVLPIGSDIYYKDVAVSVIEQ